MQIPSGMLKHMNKYIKYIVGLVLLFLGISAYNLYRSNQSLQTNLGYYTDSLRTYKLKDSTNLFVRNQLELDKKDLYKELNLAKQTIKEIEKVAGKTKTVTKIKTVYSLDTLVLQDTLIITPTDTIRTYKHQDKYLDLEAQYRDSLRITKLNLYSNLVVGEGKEGFWVKSDNPYMHVGDIQSVRIKQSKVKFVYGVGVSAGYNLLHHNIYFGPGAFVGLSL